MLRRETHFWVPPIYTGIPPAWLTAHFKKCNFAKKLKPTAEECASACCTRHMRTRHVELWLALTAIKSKSQHWYHSHLSRQHSLDEVPAWWPCQEALSNVFFSTATQTQLDGIWRKTCAVTELLASLMNKSALGLGDDVKRPLRNQHLPTVFGSYWAESVSAGASASQLDFFFFFFRRVSKLSNHQIKHAGI